MISAFLPHSEFHRALQISYPNVDDLVRAETLGVRPGGRIMIHGLDPALRRRASYHWMFNWTNGCIAVSNADMVDIWLMTPDYTPIQILP